MFSIVSGDRENIAGIPIASVRIQLSPDDEKLMIRREMIFDDPEIRFDLYDQIADVINQADRILSPSGSDRYGVLITGTNENGGEVRIGISYRNWSQVNADLILHHIEQKLNSSETLYLSLTFTFSVKYADGNFNLGKKINWNGNASWYAANKKCIIQIHPENDPFNNLHDCLWQFLVLGYSFLVFKNKITSKLEFINQTTYKKLVSSSSKFKARKELAGLLKQFIGKETFESIIETFEEHFKINIVLYSFNSFLNIEYPKKHLLPLQETKECIFGLVTSINNSEWEHVDFITNPTALSLKKNESSRICLHCFEIYTRKRNCVNNACSENSSTRCLNCHTCSGVCLSCFNPDCIFDNQLHVNEKCTHCNVIFKSFQCKELHSNFCGQSKSKVCDQCPRNQHRGLKCNEYSCMMCGMKETFENKENHACFLKRQKLKKITQSYWTYDFETCLNTENDHVLYLATVTALYWNDKYNCLKEKYPFNDVNGYVVFYFWGLQDVYTFFDFVCEPVLNGSTFFAHNAGKYDAIFIEKYLFDLKKLHCSKIQQGLRIMQLYYNQLEVTFKDSLLFIPTNLRSMSTDFGISEFKKGFFPHKLMTVEYLKDSSSTNYIVKTPEKIFFDEDFSFFSSEKDKEEFEKFFTNFSEQVFWNLKKDAIDYCVSDTILLAEVLKTFREKTLQITSSDFDPLGYVTLPSAVMKYYLSTFLPEKSISIIDRYSSLIRIESKLWILWCEKKLNCFITTSQKYIENILIEGIFSQKVFIFHPCYDHGCKFCYRGKLRNFRSSKTFNECYLQAYHDEQLLISKGYMVESIWEHEWLKIKDSKEFNDWFNENNFEIDEKLPLDPRDAYKGGVSELYKFTVRDNIQMVDFVSQYPTALLGSSFSPYTNEKVNWYLPVGSAKRININNYELNDKLAVVKCKVLPPSKLYAPFLGYKAKSILSGSYEVIYGLCRNCMENRNLQLCSHSNIEREFIGTWTSVELHYALMLGYKITKMIDVWEYESKSNSLFHDFITPFMITKIISKRNGIVENNEFTEKGKLICDYVKDVCNRDLITSEFNNKPAERMIAKLMMNSFYGKWGQRSSWPETATFSSKEIEKCLKILSDPTYQILFGEVVKRNNSSFLILEYEKRIATVKGDSNKNDHIAAFVTAYGRIMLNTLIQKVGKEIIYSDTDSAFLCKHDPLPFYTGFRIGDLELELEDGRNWCGLGRKSYSFETNEKIVCKQKGISLKKSMNDYFTPDYLRSIFLETRKSFYALKNDREISDIQIFKKLKKDSEEGSLKSIIVEQKKFQSVREDRLTMKKKSIVQEKRTAFLLWGLKRIPLWDNVDLDIIDSRPFGYSL